MAYRKTVDSSTTLATASAATANLSNTLFVTTNNYFSNRMKAYYSLAEVKADSAIPTTSNAYAALLTGFQQSGTSPIWLGRREADSLVLTPTTVADNATYGLTITVTDDATSTDVVSVVSIDSGTSATDDSIATAIYTDMTSTSPVSNISVVDSTGSVTITADAGYTYTIAGLTKLADTYTTSETAATLLTALLKENSDDWYFLACEDHTETFTMAMAAEIEGTGDDNPKEYSVSYADENVLTPLADPAIDTMGKLQALGYKRTRSVWHHDADTIFPEVADTAYGGQFDAGSSTWKFMTPMTGIEAARDPSTGAYLSKGLQGYIADRNGNWHGYEKGINFNHGGKQVGGEWTDVIRGADWLNDEIEVRVLNLLANQPGNKISFIGADKQRVKSVYEGVLADAVNRKFLSGYEPVTIPDSSSFTDQAERILRDVAYTGYLASAVHFVISNGNLTYSEEELS